MHKWLEINEFNRHQPSIFAESNTSFCIIVLLKATYLTGSSLHGELDMAFKERGGVRNCNTFIFVCMYTHVGYPIPAYACCVPLRLTQVASRIY